MNDVKKTGHNGGDSEDESDGDGQNSDDSAW